MTLFDLRPDGGTEFFRSSSSSRIPKNISATPAIGNPNEAPDIASRRLTDVAALGHSAVKGRRRSDID